MADRGERAVRHRSDVVFWVVDPLVGHPVLASLPGQIAGVHDAAANAGHALDYVKAPLFD